MCVTICGRFRPDEGAGAGYGNRIREKYTAKWGMQIAGMVFQTCSGAYFSVNAQYYNIKDPPHTSILKKFTFWYEKGLRF